MYNFTTNMEAVSKPKVINIVKVVWIYLIAKTKNTMFKS